MVSAICPNCKILLVEANSSAISDLGTAVDEAATLGADVISNSYGEGEAAGDTSDDAYYDHPGIMVTASSGDSGYGTSYPAASPYVTSVGGTTLTKNANTPRGWSETAWSDAGSGCSSYEPKPAWQTDTGCSRRTIADVSADADPNTGVAVYDSDSYQGASGWLVFGGTSVSNAIIASVYALGGSTGSLIYGSSPYKNISWLNNVTSGSDGSCGGSYLCTAGPGYNGPTGLGTPAGDAAFGGASSPPTVTGVSPSSGPLTGGTAVTVTGTGFVAGSTFAVDFGNTPATNVTLVSPDQLTATAPSGSGTANVTVTTPAATSAATSADEYTYVTPPPPTVTGLSPASGATGGGTSVIITGTNLTGATAVVFGTTAATSFTVSSGTSITAVSPPGSGTVNVKVTTPGGPSATSSADDYTYVASAGITAVGSLASKNGTDVTTLSVVPANVGDVLVLGVKVSSSTITASSVSGGGASTWTKLSQHSADGVDTELWMGPVVTTGPATVSVTFSASVTSVGTELVAQEFSSGLGSSTTWALDKAGSQTNASSTTVGLPSLTPAKSGELYVGYAWVLQEGETGSTAGVTYDIVPTSDNVFLYDPTTSATLAPAATQTPAGTSVSVGALLTATG
jgi:hypothetical protein